MTKWYWRKVAKRKQGQKSKEDCYFYHASTCSRGDLCPYRHEPKALGCEELCPNWRTRGKCRTSHCPYRHLNSLQKPCTFENTSLGCCNPTCPYLHEKHRTNLDQKSERCGFENTPQGCSRPDCPFLHKKNNTTSAPAVTLQTKVEFSRDESRGSSESWSPTLTDSSTFKNPSLQFNSQRSTSSRQDHLDHRLNLRDTGWKLNNKTTAKSSTITSSQLSDQWTARFQRSIEDHDRVSNLVSRSQNTDFTDPWVDGLVDDDNISPTVDSGAITASKAANPGFFSHSQGNKDTPMPTLLPDSDSEDDLPPGWEERATVDGSVYYVNHGTKSTQWTHPRTGKKKTVAGELPFGWEKVVEDSGKILYVDHENHRTTYTDPRLAFAQEEKDTPLGFRQRFDGSSTALQVLHGRDLSGKTAVVTGANCGIGFETARALARHGCHVVLACRSVARASKAIEDIRAERPQALCTAIQLNLCSLRSVKEFANSLRGDPKFNRGIDILILNAGVFAMPYSLTEDGLESTFQINHLSQFYLTLLLEEMLAKAAPSRVVFVSSESHRFSMMNSSNISEEWLNPRAAQYWSMMAYNDSKLCNVIAARDLARRWVTRDICVFSCHPGNMVSSDLARHWCPYRLLFTLVRPFTKSLEQAASTQIYCASALELSDVSGLYFNNCCRCEPSKPSQDPELAAKLWNLSISLIGSHFSSLDIPDKYRNKR